MSRFEVLQQKLDMADTLTIDILLAEAKADKTVGYQIYCCCAIAMDLEFCKNKADILGLYMKADKHGCADLETIESAAIAMGRMKNYSDIRKVAAALVAVGKLDLDSEQLTGFINRPYGADDRFTYLAKIGKPLPRLAGGLFAVNRVADILRQYPSVNTTKFWRFASLPSVEKFGFAMATDDAEANLSALTNLIDCRPLFTTAASQVSGVIAITKSLSTQELYQISRLVERPPFGSPPHTFPASRCQ
jgi:hypothetical protein